MSVNFWTMIPDSPQDTGGPSVNMANGNAARVLHFLGYTHEDDYLGGHTTAKDLQARIDTARRTVATNLDFEYLDGRLDALQEVVDFAKKGQLLVVWG